MSKNNNNNSNNKKNGSTTLLLSTTDDNNKHARNNRRSRTQYHYVYGSIPENYEDNENTPLISVVDDPSTEAAPTSDQDSLIGESLIPTDDESGLSSTLGSESDFTHLLMTNGHRTSLQKLSLPNGRGKVVGGGGGKRRSSSGKIASPKVSSSRRWYNLHPMALRQCHPMLFGILIFVTGLLITGLVAVLFFPNSPVAQATSRAATGQNLPYPVPWPRVHRASYGDAVENFINLDLMDPALVKNDGKSTFAFPFPSGAFWTNFVLKQDNDSNDAKGLSYPVAVYPYAYKWSDDELQLSYPRQHRNATTTELRDEFIPDLRLTSVGPVNRRYIVAFDPLSVTLRYQVGNKGSMTAFLVQGSPYWTVQFSGVAPVLTALTTFSAVTCPKDADLAALGVVDNDEDGSGRRRRRRRKLSYGVCTQNDKSSSSSSSSTNTTTLQGVQFILQSQEGMVWYVFASEPLTWTFDRANRRSLTATEAFTGVLRVALVPTDTLPPMGSTSSSSSSQTLDSADSYLKSTGLARLIYHAGVYPTSGSVSWSFTSTSSGSGGGDNAASLAVHFASKTVTGIAAAVAGATVMESNSSSSAATSSSSNNRTTTNTTDASSLATSGSTDTDTAALPVDRVATLTFKFNTQSFIKSSSATPEKKLLMLALPHHARNLSPSALLNSNKFDLVFECIKGALRPVLGSTWSYNVALPTIGLDGDRGATDDFSAVLRSPTVRSTLLANLDQDVRLALPSYDENIYGFGKQTARLAQLLHVATKLRNAMSDDNGGDNNSNVTSTNATTINNQGGWGKAQSMSLGTLIKDAQSHLNASLELLFSGSLSDSLVFDEDLGGLVSLDGLNNSMADYGNGRYSDHHFHYGYILYASAILAGLDPQFVEQHGKKVDAIMYDVAYEGNFASSRQRTSGPFFPGARHKSWFDGHSFASGLFPAANGKSQESSSEAVNCYYGVYLWSLARNGYLSRPAEDTSPITDFARLLLATEISGAKTYWQMLPPVNTGSASSLGNKTSATSSSSANSPQLPQRGVYSTQFSQNLMVGNVGMLDAVCRTWFGAKVLYVHMINFLPVTTATGELFTKAYAGQEYQAVLKDLNANAAWVGYVIANQAISDPNAAWTRALGVSSPKLDPGLSKTQLLYWIATRKGFSLNNTATPSSGPSSVPVPSSGSNSSSATSPPSSPTSSSSESCSSNAKCATLGLFGKCCPTPSGVFLECCER